MEQIFLKKDGKDRLLLIFGGWGTWPGLFAGCEFRDDTDVMLCFDYRTSGFSWKMLDAYSNVRLLAWSMGVRMAAEVFSSGSPSPQAFTWDRKIAVGGTMHPIDDLRGIPVAIFNGTLDRMSPQVLDRFNRRMCGKDLTWFQSCGQDRTAQELKDELAALKAVCGLPVPDFRWDIAVGGTSDMIFPIASQRTAWMEAGVPLVEAGCTHYSRMLFDRLLAGTEPEELCTGGCL